MLELIATRNKTSQIEKKRTCFTPRLKNMFRDAEKGGNMRDLLLKSN